MLQAIERKSSESVALAAKNEVALSQDEMLLSCGSVPVFVRSFSLKLKTLSWTFELKFSLIIIPIVGTIKSLIRHFCRLPIKIIHCQMVFFATPQTALCSLLRQLCLLYRGFLITGILPQLQLLIISHLLNTAAMYHTASCPACKTGY